MINRSTLVRTTLSTALVIALASCGGGSSSPVAPATGATISGTAATGAAFAGATITVLDKSGTVVGTGTSGTDGKFTITLSVGATGPFVLQAVRDDQTLVSVAADASTSTINITPITNLIAARLSASGDPAKLIDELKANATTLTADAIAAKVAEVVTALQPLLDAAGVTGNPITTQFTADGTGADRVLDALQITVTPNGASGTTIEIAVKGDDSITPIIVSSSTTTLSALPTVDPTKLPPSGLATLIAAHLAKLTACLALPVADRVNTPETGVATDIKATTCKEVFSNDDPTTFKSNGNVVAANGAFGGIFKDAATGTVFDSGNYAFTRANGDIVVSYRSTDASGNVNYDQFALRPDSTTAPTKLQQIGNQYDYDGGIKPYQQLRSFVTQATNDYYSVGWAISINNARVNGVPIFDRVEVVSPKNVTFTFKPRTGYGSLQLVRSGSVLGTSYIRLRGEYLSTSKAGQDPAIADSTQFFVGNGPDDATIQAIPTQTVWTFNYFLAGNTGTTPDTVQTYRTRARPLSIGELKQRAFAALTDTQLAGIASGIDPIKNAVQLDATDAPGIDMNWTVPTGALPVINLRLWGSAGTAGFSDNKNVLSTARTGTVQCVKSTANDAHCSGTTVGAPSNYLTTDYVNALHLLGRESTSREFAHLYALYTIGNGGE